MKLDEEHSIDRNLTGLVATKIANEYQKPTLVLNETVQEDGSILWQGSGRIFSQSNFTTFRKFLDESGYFEFATGHEGAFGAAIADSAVEPFIKYSNELLVDFDFTPKYNIDLMYDASILTGEDIMSIALYDGLWGQGVEEPFILIKNLKITKDNIQLLKETTLKITAPGDFSLIKFGSSKEEYDALYSDLGYVSIDVIGHFQKNVWNGNISPQIMIEDFEIINRTVYYF